MKKNKILKYRWLSSRLPDLDTRRIVVITGARQTGKTTLSRLKYPGLNYINLDSIEDRQAVAAIRTASWAGTVGKAIIDEAQKEPAVFDKVKWAFDQEQIDFSVLTGSSRILLMSQVKETMAGRAFLFNLWPLMASEIRSGWDSKPEFPLIHDIIQESANLGQILAKNPAVLLGQKAEDARSAIDHISKWGGMPELLYLDINERHEWLRSYQQTFLERDLADLARLRDLAPFLTLQHLAMLRSGSLLSFSELARDAGISVNTARRFLEYLRISYQTIMLMPWYRNLTSRVVKTPKLYWVDMGILRQGTGRWGAMDGGMFETLVISEIYKWINTMSPDTRLYFYRTRSGLEVDLIIETGAGIIGVEIKNRPRVVTKDLSNLKKLAAVLEREWKGGIVVYSGNEIKELSEEWSIWSIPLYMLV